MYSDLGRTVERCYRLGPGSAVLIRPDGVGAWRHDGPARCTGVLTASVRQAAGLTAASAAA